MYPVIQKQGHRTLLHLNILQAKEECPSTGIPWLMDVM